MYVRPFTIAIRCAALGLLLVKRRGRRRRRRSTRQSSPDERTARTQRSRRRNVHLALCRAERHVGGVGAREAASRKPDERGQTKERTRGSQGESRARVQQGRFSGSRCEKSPNRPHIYLAPERGARGADPGDGWMVTSCLRGMSNPDPFPSLSPLELEVEQLDSRTPP